VTTRRPEKQIKVLLANLPDLTESLEKGCVVIYDALLPRVLSGRVEKKKYVFPKTET
jgi:hypothetical protein